ncbi:MAG: PQQ-binding-like beta-propeller repeat protein [Verrucomicrobia bacterium]|nr:PQQ-binding-like beta-propeller repeat protein [Verrucomicrobiota bacterium]
MKSGLSVNSSLISLWKIRWNCHANWPSWRGPDNNGSTTAGSYPVKWDADHVLWKTSLPGKGCSTPIVWNERIYLTAPVDGQDAVLAFDWSGKLLWQSTLGPESKGKHQNGSGSNPSPVTDGNGIFVYFKSGHFAAVEFDGKIRWKENLVDRFGEADLFWDHGTSPVLTKEHVIMARMHGGESWLAAFDKISGELRWRVARDYEVPTEVDHGYNTPVVFDRDGTQALLVWCSARLTAHDAANGKTLWSCGDFNPRSTAFWPAVASPVIAGDMAIVCFGRADKGQPRLHGVKLGGSGEVTATHRLWKREDTGSFVPTPAEYKGRIYVVGDRGQVECIDPVTGKSDWSGEFPRARFSFYASPTLADGKLYAAREDGTVFVAKVDNGFEVLAENQMGERVIASPVPIANRLLIRGEKHLFCVALD